MREKCFVAFAAECQAPTTRNDGRTMTMPDPSESMPYIKQNLHLISERCYVYSEKKRRAARIQQSIMLAKRVGVRSENVPMRGAQSVTTGLESEN